MTVEIDPKEVEKLAGQGLTIGQIASCIGVGRSTLHKHKVKNVAIRDSIKKGRAQGMSAVTNAMFVNATEKHNVTAQIFYLKNRDPSHWQDRRQNEVSGPGGKPIPILPFEYVDAKPTDTK